MVAVYIGGSQGIALPLAILLLCLFLALWTRNAFVKEEKSSAVISGVLTVVLAATSSLTLYGALTPKEVVVSVESKYIEKVGSNQRDAVFIKASGQLFQVDFSRTTLRYADLTAGRKIVCKAYDVPFVGISSTLHECH